MRKRCFKCKRQLPIEEFYAHGETADGRLGKCKDCAKDDSRKHYRNRREQYSLYERTRNRDPLRRQARMDYQRRHRAMNPLKYKARAAVSYAVRKGRLLKQPCRVCGSKAQAHHNDYARPLDVDWLCFKHHREVAHGQVVSDQAA